MVGMMQCHGFWCGESGYKGMLPVVTYQLLWSWLTAALTNVYVSLWYQLLRWMTNKRSPEATITTAFQGWLWAGWSSHTRAGVMVICHNMYTVFYVRLLSTRSKNSWKPCPDCYQPCTQSCCFLQFYKTRGNTPEQTWNRSKFNHHHRFNITHRDPTYVYCTDIKDELDLYQ